MSRAHLRAAAIGVKLRRYKSNHDEGSGAIDAATGRVTPVKHWNNKWAWWSFRHGALAGQTPTYLIAKADRFAAAAASEGLGFWARAADADAWTQFATQTIGASDISLQHDAAFPAGKVYLAALPMYPWGRVARKVAGWRAHAYVSDTQSGSGGVVGTLASRDAGDGSGRIAPALPLYGFKVSSGAGAKNNVILAAYCHPNETQGAWQLEGALDWLLGGSAQAEFLLDYCNFFVYPCLNPQGVWAGYFRSSPETPTSDHNRLWDTTGTNEAVDQVKAAMLADTGGATEIGLDFHGALGRPDGYMDSDDHASALYAAFLAKMQGYDAAFAYSDVVVASMLRALWKGTYSAKLAVIVEGSPNKAAGLPGAWVTQGANALKGLAQMLADGRWTQGPGVGSRDFNGLTDRLDFANPFDPAGQALTISAWVYVDVNGTNNYIACFHDGGDTQYGCIFNTTNGDLNFGRHGTTDYLWYKSSGGDVPTGQWAHVLVTSDGGLLSGSAALYLNGAAVAKGYTAGTGSETAHTGKLSIGGRFYSDTRNFDGKIAQLAVWNRALSAGEIANLAAGYAPDLVDGGSSLKFYFRGNISSLTAAVGGDGTADGTTSVTGVGNGPGIVYG